MKTIEATDEQVKQAKAYADDLRKVAEFIENNPLLPLPEKTTISVFHQCDNKSVLAAFARAFGKSEKSYSDYLFYLTHDFGTNCHFRVVATRSTVCKQITEPVEVEEEVGVEFEEKTVQVPTKYEKRTVTKEVTRWECSEPLLA